MNTGQTFITIGALVLLMTTLVGFYRLLSHNGERLEISQSGITSTTIATSLMEVAANLAFDSVTDTTNDAIDNISLLTAPGALGNEGTLDDSLQGYDDFDDFNADTLVRAMPGGLGVFTCTFAVNYVNPDNVNEISTNRTYVKRLDMRIWRSWPLAAPGEIVDTTRMSMVHGYFHFD
jgi:hypothetical protein